MAKKKKKLLLTQLLKLLFGKKKLENIIAVLLWQTPLNL